MARKPEPILISLFTQDGTPIERLTPEMIRRQEENLSRNISEFCTRHPEVMQCLMGKDYIKITPVAGSAGTP